MEYTVFFFRHLNSEYPEKTGWKCVSMGQDLVKNSFSSEINFEVPSEEKLFNIGHSNLNKTQILKSGCGPYFQKQNPGLQRDPDPRHNPLPV
jgi:hypothetical protein